MKCHSTGYYFAILLFINKFLIYKVEMGRYKILNWMVEETPWIWFVFNFFVKLILIQ